uniref:Uncharacterized protein n=1 Tax=Anguilla anguilla TaxID=7936 RepID=A0A0E9QI83_ANGAN
MRCWMSNSVCLHIKGIITFTIVMISIVNVYYCH